MEITHSINIFKALADTSRLMIVNCLMERPYYVEELAERLSLAASTISFHLKKLEKAGLAAKTKEQYYTTYHLNERIFNITLKELVCFKNIEKSNQEGRIREYRAKIITTFFNRGKLTKLPAQHKKRDIVLAEILKRFDAGRTYDEAEVNAVIAGCFEDHCTIRRVFVENGWMERKEGRYKRRDTGSPESGTLLLTPSKETAGPLPGKESKMSANQRQKELKKAYMEQGPGMGIFRIKNTQTNRCLIGASRNLKGSLNSHQFQLKYGVHRNADLQQEWNHFGSASFVFEIIDELEPTDRADTTTIIEELAELESLWRAKLDIKSEQEY